MRNVSNKIIDNFQKPQSTIPIVTQVVHHICDQVSIQIKENLKFKI